MFLKTKNKGKKKQLPNIPLPFQNQYPKMLEKFKQIKSLKLIASVDRELGFENYGQPVWYVWFRFNPIEGRVQLTCALGAFVNELFLKKKQKQTKNNKK